MKRVMSVLLAVSSLVAVSAIALFTLVQSNVIFSSASASPVFATGSITAASIDKNAFVNAQDSLKQKGIILSNSPAIRLPGTSYVSVAVADNELQASAQMLDQEFSKYTTQNLTKSGLKKIYLVKSLAVDGQLRSGMPEPIFEDALYFDVSAAYTNSEDGAYMRRTFHHEFSHLIDYNLYGSYAPKNVDWTDCNVADFRYGNGGPAMYANVDYAHEYHPEDGFITGYATSGLEEDRAETFAWFMTSPQDVTKLSSIDNNFSCKVNAVKKTFLSL